MFTCVRFVPGAKHSAIVDLYDGRVTWRLLKHVTIWRLTMCIHGQVLTCYVAAAHRTPGQWPHWTTNVDIHSTCQSTSIVCKLPLYITCTGFYGVTAGYAASDSKLSGTVMAVCYQGAYKFGKMKFPEFSRLSRPTKWLFPENYKEKTRCNELT